MGNKNGKQIEKIDFNELVKYIEEYDAWKQNWPPANLPGHLKEIIRGMNADLLRDEGLQPYIEIGTADFEDVIRNFTDWNFAEAYADEFNDSLHSLLSTEGEMFKRYTHAIFHLIASEEASLKSSDIGDFIKCVETKWPDTEYIFGVTVDPLNEVGFKIQVLVYNIKPNERPSISMT